MFFLLNILTTQERTPSWGGGGVGLGRQCFRSRERHPHLWAHDPQGSPCLWPKDPGDRPCQLGGQVFPLTCTCRAPSTASRRSEQPLMSDSCSSAPSSPFRYPDSSSIFISFLESSGEWAMSIQNNSKSEVYFTYQQKMQSRARCGPWQRKKTRNEMLWGLGQGTPAPLARPSQLQPVWPTSGAFSED